MCPLCKGTGFFRYDVSAYHPLFGKKKECVCLLQRRREKRSQEMLALCEQAGFQRTKRLETFRPQVRGLQKAFLKTRAFIQQLEEWATARDNVMLQGAAAPAPPAYWLLLAGPPGVGKTHLMMAVGNAALDADISTLFMTVADLLDYLREAYNPQGPVTYDKALERLKTVELLLLDEFGTESSTDWASEKVFQLVNYRYVQRLPTLFTMNRKDWAYLEDRIQSRFSDASLVITITIDADDYRLSQGGSNPG